MCAEELLPHRMTALGAIETNSVAHGFFLADEAVKTADVRLVEATAVCAGKFLAIFDGSPVSVKSSLDSCRVQTSPGLFFRQLYLARVHPSVVPALVGDFPSVRGSLGLFEGYSALDSLRLADEVAKRCSVSLLEIRLGRGLGGKSTLSFCGEQPSVEEAVEWIRDETWKEGLLSDVLVIPRPSQGAIRASLPDGPGHACRGCTGDMREG